MENEEENGQNKVWGAMVALHKLMKETKPEGRSELARRHAVAITGLEQVMGFYELWVIQNSMGFYERWVKQLGDNGNEEG